MKPVATCLRPLILSLVLLFANRAQGHHPSQYDIARTDGHASTRYRLLPQNRQFPTVRPARRIQSLWPRSTLQPLFVPNVEIRAKVRTTFLYVATNT